MKRNNIRCPNCGAKTTLRPASVVYGKADKTNGFLYVCDRYPRCDSYVKAHRKTLKPMGTLADANLRHKRILAHKAFDRLWQGSLMTKRQAYKWMQAKFGLSSEQAHIAKFSAYMCDQLIAVCDQFPFQRKSA